MKKPMKTLTGVALGGALSLFALSASAWWGSNYYGGPWGYGGPWYGYGYGYPGYGWGGYPGYWGGGPYGWGGPYGYGGYPYGGYGWGGYPYGYGYGYPAVVAPVTVQPTAPQTPTAKWAPAPREYFPSR